jgi:hypothetical protein
MLLPDSVGLDGLGFEVAGSELVESAVGNHDALRKPRHCWEESTKGSQVFH